MATEASSRELVGATTTISRSESSMPMALVVGGSTAALAAFMVLRHLATKPLWRDEAISISVASRPVTRLISVLPHHDANAGLFYLVLHGWLRLGQGRGWNRGLPALCFVATAALAGWIGTRWRGWRFGLACGLLVATNPFLVYYGQEARPYALAALLALLSTVTLFRRDEEPAPLGYVVATVALIYTVLFAVLFVAAQAVAVVAVHRWRGSPLPPVLTRCWVVVAGFTAPLALIMVFGEGAQIGWLPRPSRRALAHTMLEMASGRLGLAVVVALAVGAVAVLAARGGQSRERLVIWALVAGFLVPPLLLWTLAQIVPSFIDRYVISSTIAMIGLACLGIEVVGKRAGPVAALATLVLLAGLGVQQIAKLEGEPFKVDNAPAAVAFVASHDRPGDAIGFAGGGLRTLIDAAGAPPPGFPNDVALAPRGEAFRRHDLYAREVNAATLMLRLVPIDRLWLVTDAADGGYPREGPFAQLRPTLTMAFVPGASATLGAVAVTLYVRRSSAAPLVPK